MAQGFTTTLPQPSNDVKGSVGNGNGELDSAVGGAIAGLGVAADKFIDRWDSDKEQGVLKDVTNSLFEQEQAYTSQPKTPDLIGQADPEGEAAKSSPS